MSNNTKLERAIVKLSEHYDFRHVVERALLNGIFTATGLFLGAVFVFIVVSRFLAGVKEIPFLDDFLKQSKLDIVIESQLNELSGTSEEDVETNKEVAQSVQLLTYTNTFYDFEFTYPQLFGAFSEGEIADMRNAYVITMSDGKLYLDKIEVLINVDLEFSGTSYKRSVENPNIGPIDLYVYEEGAVFDGTNTSNPIIISEIRKGETSYLFIAHAKENNSAISRELMLNLLASIK